MTEQQIADRMAQMIRVGFVSARQPERMRVRVELRDTVNAGLVTDWLPVLCPRASRDMVHDLPDVGDQVLCLFLSYGLEQGFVLGAMYGRQSPPVTSGDKWHRTFSDGTTLEYDRASHTLSGKIQGHMNLSCTGNMTLEAPLVYVRGTLVNTAKDGSAGKSVFSGGMTVTDGGINVLGADVVASGVSLVSHLTTGVQPGSGQSSNPAGGSASSPGTASGTGFDISAAAKFAAVAEAIAAALATDESPQAAKDSLLLCLPNIAKAMADRQARPEDAQGWLYLHDMLQRWFSGAASTDADHCGTPFWVDWDWVMKFGRASARYTIFTEIPQQLDPHVVNVPALIQLGKILCRKGYMDPEKRMDFDFTNLPWTEWEDVYHTLIAVPRSTAVDGSMAALAGFSLRALAAGYTVPDGKGGHVIHVQKIAVFVHDRFQFAKDKTPEENNLGWWSCSELDGGIYSEPIGNDGRYRNLWNEDFRNFATTHGFGKDFLVLSQPHVVADFMEHKYECICK